jgi:hypothetical protein
MHTPGYYLNEDSAANAFAKQSSPTDILDMSRQTSEDGYLAYCMHSDTVPPLMFQTL